MQGAKAWVSNDVSDPSPSCGPTSGSQLGGLRAQTSLAALVTCLEGSVGRDEGCPADLAAAQRKRALAARTGCARPGAVCCLRPPGQGGRRPGPLPCPARRPGKPFSDSESAPRLPGRAMRPADPGASPPEPPGDKGPPKPGHTNPYMPQPTYLGFSWCSFLKSFLLFLLSHQIVNSTLVVSSTASHSGTSSDLRKSPKGFRRRPPGGSHFLWPSFPTAQWLWDTDTGRTLRIFCIEGTCPESYYRFRPESRSEPSLQRPRHPVGRLPRCSRGEAPALWSSDCGRGACNHFL